MPTVSQITEMRQRRRLRDDRSPAGRLGLGCSGLISLLLALAGIILAYAYADLTRSLPPVESLPVLLDPSDGPLMQPTRLYDQTGEHLLLSLENPCAPGRSYLRLASSAEGQTGTGETSLLPSNLITATLASADPRFWQHAGFSLAGLAQDRQATLAQRLAADLLLSDEPAGLRRALRERLLAAQMTEQYGRDQVLEWYLNSANYGHLAYGADAAARFYFGKPASELSLAQAALLAAAAETPELNPVDAPQAALERQKRIIQDMLRYRLISPEQGVQAAQEELTLASAASVEASLAPAFTSLALRQLQTQIPSQRLERGGLRVLTSLDYELQLQAACAAQIQVARAQGQPVNPAVDQADCQAARLLPTSTLKIDPYPGGLEANVIILDPLNGKILALVGSAPEVLQETALPDRPAGSLATTFTYLTAFTRGFSPASLVWDIPGEDPASGGQNFDGLYHGPMRLRTALANDYLVPAQQVLNQVGIENVWRTAQQIGAIPAGAQFDQDADNPFFLDQLNLLDVSRALAVFANQGVLSGRILEASQPASSQSASHAPALQPVVLERVEEFTSQAGQPGQVWLEWNSYQTRPIITPQLAYLMTQALSDETARWPSLGHPNALEIGRPSAARLGRDASGSSNWAVGYIPQRVVGVWLGPAHALDVLPADSSGGVLPQAAAGLWHALMQYASQEFPSQAWLMPGGISTAKVCDPSGLLPTRYCPNIVTEIFLEGSEPTQVDTLYRPVQINRETGRLATVFTSLDLIDERIFLITPPEAAAWARTAALPSPPASYDLIPIDLPSWPEAAVQSPAMFAVVRGQVPITGVASGEEFASYRIQVGPGLNPQAWLQVGEEITQPISNSLLATWDTTGLSGLYAVQLLVIREDQSLRRAAIMVTVDNQPPQVQIEYPSGGAELELARQESAVLQAAISDNLALQSVDFYIDGRLLTSFSQPPYAISWTLKAGSHTLRVVATDQAGNTSEASVTFVVK
ncbi:MAG: transglycosylase domain-containing protein [Anaerolineales bacterium]|nr:transglycosylase domain-containing protein [Anaerolineales bacterium]